MVFDDYSDYGSGGSWSSSTSSLWHSREKWPSYQSQDVDMKPIITSNMDAMMRGRSLDDVMKEFRMNGSDSPYNPDDDNIWRPRAGETILGMSTSGSGSYLRQHSWPAAERPAPLAAPAPAPASASAPARPLAKWQHKGFATSTPIFDDPAPFQPVSPMAEAPPLLTAEQSRVLNSLSNDALYSLIRTLKGERKRPNQECRFCKNNGERESYYRSHSLKAGGAVACPVLRAFVCRRCGATGDAAHTLKYCPRATPQERLKSMAMMRSVRLASSGRRRYGAAARCLEGAERAPPVARDSGDVTDQYYSQLDPLWAELERKLML